MIALCRAAVDNTDVRFNVAPIEDVMFNNVLCSMVSSAAAAGGGCWGMVAGNVYCKSVFVAGC